MNRYLLIIISFFLGVFLGVIVFAIFSSGYERDKKFVRVAEIKSLTSEIYNTGNIESSIIILNYLLSKIDSFEESLKEYASYDIDKGLAHGRLCLLYKKIGEDDCSDRECTKAIELLEQKYKIQSKEDLIETMYKIDSKADVE